VEAIIQKSIALGFEREIAIDPTKYFRTHLKRYDGYSWAVLEKLTVPFLVASSGPQEKI